MSTSLHKKATQRALWEYFQEYKKYPWLSLTSFFLPAIGSVFVFFVPPLIVADIVNTFAKQGFVSFAAVEKDIILFGLLWFLGELCWRFSMYLLTKLEAYGIDNLSNKSFAYLLERDHDFYSNNFVGSLTKKAQTFSKSFERFTDLFSFEIMPNLLPMIFALVILARYSIWISVFLASSLVVVVFMIRPFIKKRAGLVALRHDASSRMTGELSDSLTNILAVKSFAQENAESEKFAKSSSDFVEKFRKAAYYHIFPIDSILSPMYVLTNMVGLAAAVFFAQKFHLLPGTLLVVFSYYSTVTRSFWQINHVYRTFESTIGEAAEFTALILDKPAVLDVPNAGELKSSDGAITFDSVHFSYEENHKDKPFLENFFLTIKANEKIGLVGPSGGGKTTITRLLLRFIDIQEGTICIDGQDIASVSQASLRASIAYVPQEPLLFHRSLFENIAYASNGATMEEVERAAKLSHADEFISKLPLGYQTLVGERGIKLSGGQRQRIAIARAMLKNAPILVLDEATSALDSESEKYIQESLWTLMESKTALVIAHRLSTIKHLDRIIVLDGGRIVQEGTHDTLIKQKGSLYAKLWEHQSGGFIEE